VGYLRKSTKEDGYEKSIADQKARIKNMRPAVAGAQYDIIRWYCDPGIPGWKRGHQRPQYFNLVNDIRERQDVQAILIDDMDRFSRADAMETVADVQALRELGVRYIHADNQGSIDIARGGPMAAMQIAMYANASHEHCTRLSRRITSTRRDNAQDGLRTGGAAAYGMVDDGAGGLKAGDPKEVQIVVWLFDQFANHLLQSVLASRRPQQAPRPRTARRLLVHYDRRPATAAPVLSWGFRVQPCSPGPVLRPRRQGRYRREGGPQRERQGVQERGQVQATRRTGAVRQGAAAP
jgi:DNA invertase Pin-like site-specific DNA recombinase